MKALILCIVATIFISATLAQTTLFGVDYGMRRNGSCPSYNELLADMRLISTYAKSVRLYNMNDCNQGQLVLQATRQLGMTVFFGVVPLPLNIYDIEKQVISNISSQLGLEGVVGISVGSEGLYRGDYDNSFIADAITDVKTLVTNLGYPNIKVCTVDVYYKIVGEVITASDILMVNAFPYWEGVTARESISTMISHVQNVIERAEGREVWVGETGWPTAGLPYGNALANPRGMQMYLPVVCAMAQMNVPTYWFSAFDQPEKDPTGGVEANWGLYYENRTIKASFDPKVIKCGPAPTSGTSTTSSSSTGPTGPQCGPYNRCTQGKQCCQVGQNAWSCYKPSKKTCVTDVYTDFSAICPSGQQACRGVCFNPATQKCSKKAKVVSL